MSCNRLKVNPTKTEFLWAAISWRQHFITRGQITLSGVNIIPLCCVKLLGINIDDDMSSSTHISKLVSSGFFYLWQIKFIHRCLPADVTKSLVNAFVVSRLDLCNSLYANLPQAQLDWMQSVFDGAARLIFEASQFSHVTPLLRDRLHWLHCPERTRYKLCITVFKALHGMAPGYIADLCLPEVISERWSMLRSALTSGIRLAVPRWSSCTRFGDQAFRVVRPTAWNSLPESIRLISTLNSFKQQLKT